jgi:predicted RNase H-like nuclease (RuvC/YqgF family)
VLIQDINWKAEMCNGCDNKRLKERVTELEQKVEDLRMSRRVLMDLIERLENENKTLKSHRKNRKIKSENNPFKLVQ